MWVDENVLREVIRDLFMYREKYMMPIFAEWLEHRISGMTEVHKDVTFWKYLIIIKRNYKYRTCKGLR